jgi:NADPH-dependent curcumin reductase CurA
MFNINERILILHGKIRILKTGKCGLSSVPDIFLNGFRRIQENCGQLILFLSLEG